MFDGRFDSEFAQLFATGDKDPGLGLSDLLNRAFMCLRRCLK